MHRRIALVVVTAVLTAAGLHSSPALADAPDYICADEVAVDCIESATITPVGGVAEPLSDAGLVASAVLETGDQGTVLRWSVDGWADQPDEIAGGTVGLVIRTGEYVPRLTTATAATVRTSRADDGQGHHTLTVTGTAAEVDWTTDPEAATLCATAMTCGDYNSAADQAGTGRRFEGFSFDLGEDPALATALDGTYLASDAQSSARTRVIDSFGSDPYFLLGPFGNPQLDATGHPVRNGVTVWLPPTYFTAVGTTPNALSPGGFDVVGISQNGTGSLTVVASAVDGGWLLDVPELGFGSALGMLVVYTHGSRAALGQAVPGAPQQVRAMADVSGGARVSWQPPASVYGSPVTAYRARAYAAGDGTLVGSCTSGTLSCDLSGLSPDQDYQVRVTAVSALGEGSPADGVIDRPTAPSAPLGPVLAPGPGRVTLSWTAPQSTGGQPVTGYTVRAYRTAAGGSPFTTCTAPATRRNCTVSGLTNGARVYLSVAATNMVGTSVETARVSGAGWTVASAPRSPVASSSRSRVTVGWTPPAVIGGTRITGYQVALWTAARGGGVAARCTGAATARACVTGTLTPGRVYYATVAAVNAVGTSPSTARVRVVVRR